MGIIRRLCRLYAESARRNKLKTSALKRVFQATKGAEQTAPDDDPEAKQTGETVHANRHKTRKRITLRG